MIEYGISDVQLADKNESMMPSFFLSSAKRRLAWTASLVAIFFALFSIATLLANYESWVMADAKYRDWNTGDKAERCAQMYAEAKPHMTEHQCGYEPASYLSTSRWLDCLMAHDSSKVEIVRAFANSKCPILGATEFGGRSYGNPILVPAWDPGSIVSYAWDRSDIKPLLPIPLYTTHLT